MIRVMVADNHPVLRAGLVVILNQQEGIRVVDDLPDGQSAVARLKQSGIDVALIDMKMPDMEGDEVIRAVLAGDGWKPRMVIYSGFVTEDLVRRALNAGACGYLDKAAGILETVKVTRAVARGEVCLCPKALAVVGADVVADAVRAASRRAFRVSAELIVEDFLAHELSKKDPTWPHDVKEVFQRVIESVPFANCGVQEILSRAGIGSENRHLSYSAHVGLSVKQHQTQLRLHLASLMEESGHSMTVAAQFCGYNSVSALCHADRRKSHKSGQ